MNVIRVHSGEMFGCFRKRCACHSYSHSHKPFLSRNRNDGSDLSPFCFCLLCVRAQKVAFYPVRFQWMHFDASLHLSWNGERKFAVLFPLHLHRLCATENVKRNVSENNFLAYSSCAFDRYTIILSSSAHERKRIDKNCIYGEIAIQHFRFFCSVSLSLSLRLYRRMNGSKGVFFSPGRNWFDAQESIRKSVAFAPELTEF